MITYGDYSDKAIRRVVCVECGAPWKGFTLQLLLDLPTLECSACKLTKKPAVKLTKSHGIKHTRTTDDYLFNRLLIIAANTNIRRS